MQTHDRLLKTFSSGQDKHLLLNNYARLFDPNLWQTIHSHFEIHSVELLAQDSGGVYTHFNKVFQTQDGTNNDYNFADLKEYQDWLNYSKSCYLPRDPNQEPFIGKSNTEFFQNYAIRNALYNPNNRIVIDLPNVPSEFARPYVTTIPVDNIWDLQEDSYGTQYLIVKAEEKENKFDRNSKKITKYYVYDDHKVSVWAQRDFKEPIEEGVFPHNFGICPVIASSSLLRYPNCYEYKKSPITDAFADLYDYNLLKNQIKYHVWQKAVPKEFMIDSECNGWDDNEGHWNCHNGTGTLVRDDRFDYEGIEGDNAISKPVQKNCPKCQAREKKKWNFGNNTIIPHEVIFGGEMGEGAKPETIDWVRKTLEPILADTNFIEASEKILQAKKIAIWETITGEAYNKADSKEAFNVEQIKVSSDGKIQTLSTFANDLENRQAWVETKICKIRYETFLNLQIYYGRGYFFQDEQTMLEMINLLNTTGSNISLKNDYLLKIAAKTYAKDEQGFELHKYVTAAIPYSDLNTTQFLAIYPSLWQLGEQTQLDCLVRLHGLEWLNEFKMSGEESRIMGSGWFIPSTKQSKIKDWFYAKAKAKLDLLKPPELQITEIEQTTDINGGEQEEDNTPEPDNANSEDTDQGETPEPEMQNNN